MSHLDLRDMTKNTQNCDHKKLILQPFCKHNLKVVRRYLVHREFKGHHIPSNWTKTCFCYNYSYKNRIFVGYAPMDLPSGFGIHFFLFSQLRWPTFIEKKPHRHMQKNAHTCTPITHVPVNTPTPKPITIARRIASLRIGSFPKHIKIKRYRFKINISTKPQPPSHVSRSRVLAPHSRSRKPLNK